MAKNPPSILKSRKKYGPPRIREAAITAAERVFCKELVLHGDKLKALAVAFPELDGEPKGVRISHAATLARKKMVKREVEQLRALASQDAAFEVADALSEYLAVWNADPNELGSVRVGCCRYCHGYEHGYQWREREYLEKLRSQEVAQAQLRRRGKDETEIHELEPLPDCSGGLDFDPMAEPHPDCPECGGEGVPRVVAKDTTLLSESGRKLFAGIKLTKFGPEVMVHDRLKALESAARIIGAFEDKVRVRATVVSATANINLDTDDPNEAARAYQLVMEAGLG